MKKEKKFTNPEAIVVLFEGEDIITDSGFGTGWGGDPRDEYQD